MTFPLLTQRLVLRQFTDADVEPFCTYRNDPDVAAFQSWTGCSLLEARAFVDSQKLLTSAAPGQWFQLAVVFKETGRLIGDCGFRLDAEEPRQATIGVTFARQYQGRGFATEALSALLDYLFVGLKLHRVKADTDSQNIRCSRLLQRVGFRREGHLVQSLHFKGRWADEYLYAMLRDEWVQGHVVPLAAPASNPVQHLTA
jgi:[ribosomal protein S5]-alanine N-acetyltransferase